MSHLSALASASGLATAQAPARRPSTTTATVATPELGHLLDRQTVSPMKRTKLWIEGPTPKKLQSTTDITSVRDGRITKLTGQNRKTKRKSFWGLQLLSNLFTKAQDEKRNDNLEGDTIVENEDPMSTIENDNEFTLVGDNDDVLEAKQMQRHLEDQSGQNLLQDESIVQTWSDEENWLFNKLARLGREPLLPHTWYMDFPTFPAYIFSKDPIGVLVNNTHTTLSHAAGAFRDLITSGSYVRAQIACNSPPERPLFREIKKYYKWSQLDGQFKQKQHIPVLAVACARHKESVESVVTRVTDQLYSLAAQYRDKWRHPSCCPNSKIQDYTHDLPTLYGIIIKYSVVAIVTCDASVPDKPIRTMATYDWNKGAGQDVWRAFAVAITVVRARDYLVGLDEEGELGEEIEESDPDA